MRKNSRKFIPWFWLPIIAFFVLTITATVAIFIGFYSPHKTAIKGQTALQALPEKSAIRKSVALQKAIEEESREAKKASEQKLQKYLRAIAVSKNLGFRYMIYENDSEPPMPPRMISLRSTGELPYYGHMWKEGPDTAVSRKIRAAYPECTESFFDVELDCVYTAFVLERLTKNRELTSAFNTAKQAGIRTIFLNVTFFAIDPGVLTIDVAANDEAILNFLTRDAGSK